jgi:predicted small secreted protein
MNPSHKNLILLILASALWSFAATSCNTFHGFGKDMENAGKSMQKSGQ